LRHLGVNSFGINLKGECNMWTGLNGLRISSNYWLFKYIYEPSGSVEDGKFLDQPSDCQYL